MAAILTRNPEGVLSVFDGHGGPIFAIYEGNKPLTCCTDPSPKKRRSTLSEYLQFMKDANSDGRFEIRFYDKANDNGKVTNNSEYFASLPFKVMGEEEAAMQGSFKQSSSQAPAVNGNMQFMNELFSAKLAVLDLKYQHMLEKKDEEIKELEQQLLEGDDDDYEVNGVAKVLGTIGSVGDKHPWIQDEIKGFMSTINNLFNGAKTKYTSMTERPIRMAGVPPRPAGERDLDKLLQWSQKSLIATYRQKHNVQTNEAGALIDLGNQEENEQNKDAMQKADTEYVMDMVKLAEVAASKPKTFNQAIESLREL